MQNALESGRKAVGRQAWAEAFAHLSAADRETPIEAEDLEHLALAALLVGHNKDSQELLARAHQGYLSSGQAECAARCALWLGFGLQTRGDIAQSNGWFARARRLLDAGSIDSVLRGYLLLPDARQRMMEGDWSTAHGLFVDAAAIGHRFRDRDLVTFGLHGQGRSLIGQGETARGVALLDEAMVSVMAGEVSPVISGIIYCSVIEGCHEIFDLRRAQEWTSALDRWCADQPDIVAYRGHCQVRRAEMLQLHGEWGEALDQAQRARELGDEPTFGAATYQLGELHRLRGEFDEAEHAYRAASEWQRTPHPGLAQLRLAQGKVSAAVATIRRVAEEVHRPNLRPKVLAALVDIVLAAGDVSGARVAADELRTIANRVGAPYLRALSAQATGSVLMAEGDNAGSLAAFREALSAWHELEAPYQSARLRVAIAMAFRALGDDDAADVELDAARRAFEELGASPDVARVEDLTRRPAPTSGAGRLTGREVEVLALIASGKTNKAIAKALGISEKTVARHVSNIFTKLGLSSRAAATAYAYQHRLVTSPT